MCLPSLITTILQIIYIYGFTFICQIYEFQSLKVFLKLHILTLFEIAYIQIIK